MELYLLIISQLLTSLAVSNMIWILYAVFQWDTLFSCCHWLHLKVDWLSKLFFLPNCARPVPCMQVCRTFASGLVTLSYMGIFKQLCTNFRHIELMCYVRAREPGPYCYRTLRLMVACWYVSYLGCSFVIHGDFILITHKYSPHECDVWHPRSVTLWLTVKYRYDISCLLCNFVMDEGFWIIHRSLPQRSRSIALGCQFWYIASQLNHSCRFSNICFLVLADLW